MSDLDFQINRLKRNAWSNGPKKIFSSVNIHDEESLDAYLTAFKEETMAHVKNVARILDEKEEEFVSLISKLPEESPMFMFLLEDNNNLYLGIAGNNFEIVSPFGHGFYDFDLYFEPIEMYKVETTRKIKKTDAISFEKYKVRDIKLINEGVEERILELNPYNKKQLLSFITEKNSFYQIF